MEAQRETPLSKATGHGFHGAFKVVFAFFPTVVTRLIKAEREQLRHANCNQRED
jgi:hypothetical protein